MFVYNYYNSMSLLYAVLIVSRTGKIVCTHVDLNKSFTFDKYDCLIENT